MAETPNAKPRVARKGSRFHGKDGDIIIHEREDALWLLQTVQEKDQVNGDMRFLGCPFWYTFRDSLVSKQQVQKKAILFFAMC